MYLYNEFLMNILNDINIVSCPFKSNSNTIELTVHTSCFGVINLLCVTPSPPTAWRHFLMFPYKKTSLTRFLSSSSLFCRFPRLNLFFRIFFTEFSRSSEKRKKNHIGLLRDHYVWSSHTYTRGCLKAGALFVYVIHIL